MIITRKSTWLAAVVSYVIPNREWKEPLFKLEIPSHTLVYDPDADELEQRPIPVVISKYGANGYDNVAEDTWRLQTFDEFLEGVGRVVSTAIPFVHDTEEIQAEGTITETIYVWSRSRRIKVGGGLFSKDQYEFVQEVLFGILGAQLGYARWDSDMLSPLAKLKQGFIAQLQSFLQDVRSKRLSPSGGDS